MLHHMRYQERHVLADGRLLEMRVTAERRYRLRYGRPGAWQVRYEDGTRRARGRRWRYEFRSVEQLRYDFERDVAHAAPET
jgi:hypothetical protein